MGFPVVSLSRRRAIQNSFVAQLLAVGALYVVVQFICLKFSGSGWQKFWVLKGEQGFQYWDAIHYFNLSKAPGCSAFFPLWPRTLAWLSGVLGAGGATGLRLQIVLSEILFLGQLPLVLYVFRHLIADVKIAFLMFALYALGPNAIFFSVGYTESVFSLESLCFLLVLSWCLSGRGVGLLPGLRSWGFAILLGGLSCMMNLTRPALVQTLFAGCFVLLAALWRYHFLGGASLRLMPLLRSLLAVLAGAALGYGIYGLFCQSIAGDFWGPFHQQVAWGRTLAFRPWLLLAPRSLLIDLHGLYLPALLTFVVFCVWRSALRGFAVMQIALPRRPLFWVTLIHPLVSVLACAALRPWKRLSSSFHDVDVSGAFVRLSDPVFVYCLSFSGVHSLLNLAANSGYLYSTSRHFFGAPFAFVALGVVVSSLSWQLLDRILIGLLGAGLLLLVVQWFNWAGGRWVG